MDNGEVIPGLDEEWTLGGAKLGEWMAGFIMMILAGEMFFSPVGRHGPHLIITWVATTFSMAQLRGSFPDAERGIRNFVMTALGFSPPGIPTPAALQPYWSGAPVQKIRAECEYSQLGLDDLFGPEAAEHDPAQDVPMPRMAK